MLAEERQAAIMEMLRENHSVKITEIAQRFGVANLTARRDLDLLQNQNLVRRVYGGAILTAAGRDPLIPAEVASASRQELRSIGKQAASLLQDGDIVFLGNGHTVLEVARHLHKLHNLTVITDSLAVVNELCDSGHRIYTAGGMLDYNDHAMYGANAVQSLASFWANKAIIGCSSISPAHGVADYSTVAADNDRQMLRNATQSIVVCSSYKFRSNGLSVICPLRDVDIVITDDGIRPEDRQAAEALGVTVQTVGHGSGGSDL